MTEDASHHADGPQPASAGSGSSWAGFAARAAAAIDDPELIALTREVTTTGPPPKESTEVFAALLDALVRSSSPAVIGECLLLLLDSRTALQNVGERLYTICLERARLPPGDADLRGWLLAGDFLEAATRLALGEWSPHFALLAELVKLPTTSPPLFARPALRCLAASYERWREPELVTVLERIAGLGATAEPTTSDVSTAKQWAHDVAADAAFELGCASLLQALRAETVADVEDHLQAAERRLATAAQDREDAAVMADVVRLLAVHLPTDLGLAARADTDVSTLVARLNHNVREHLLGYAQLEHWRSPRLDAEVAWVQLAEDVARTTAALNQVSWYDAGAVLADVLSAYTASRCSRVLRREDQVGIRAILTPTIESGIAVQAGLMRHLEDHIRVLEADTEPDVPGGASGHGSSGAVDRTRELDAARTLLDAARAHLSGSGGHPKAAGSAAFVAPDELPALPLLHRLLGGDDTVLDSVPLPTARRIEAALAAERHAPGLDRTSRDPLVVAETHAALQRDLDSSTYYAGEVKEVVDELLRTLLLFWRSRDGMGPSRMPYLFNPAAVEEDLARDLKVFLDGSTMAALMSTEVRDVGGGRVDVACSLPRFRLYIELKKDDRQIDVAEKRRYLAQTAGYQSADVPIGFLAVLDLHRLTGPTPHLSACFGVVVLDEPRLGQPRYIITMVVPGNRTEPSSMR